MIAMPIMCCHVGLGITFLLLFYPSLMHRLHKYVAGAICIGFYYIVFMNKVACWKIYGPENYKQSKGNKTTSHR